MLAALLLATLIGGSIGFVASKRRGESTRSATWSAVEVLVAMMIGVLASRTFLWLVGALCSFRSAAIPVVGTLFLLWPGIVDLFAWTIGGRPWFDWPALLTWAAVFGGSVGFWDGLRQIHHWRRGGVTLLLDVTWGGAATSVGLLAHVLNLGWGKPLASRRLGAHCYDAGVAAAPGYAIALGNVCGNLGGRRDGPLLRHELVHVFQNRAFGPLFLFTYLLWPVALFLPAFGWGVLAKRPRDIVWSWCYLNNPWEEWAYRRGGSRPPHLVWPTWRIAAVAAALL